VQQKLHHLLGEGHIFLAITNSGSL